MRTKHHCGLFVHSLVIDNCESPYVRTSSSQVIPTCVTTEYCWLGASTPLDIAIHIDLLRSIFLTLL